MTGDLADLAALTEAQFRAQQAKLGPVLSEERRLRRALADLDQQMRSNAVMSLAEVMDLHRLGGDVAWRRWAAQSRANLNIQLAQVLAKKADMMAGLKQAFGRAEAVAMLKRQESTAKASARTKAQINEVQTLITLKKHSDRLYQP